MLSARFLLATALLWMFMFMTRFTQYRLDLRSLKFCAVQAVVYLLSTICFFYAIQYLDASIASIILFTYPLFVAFLAILLFKERLSLIRLSVLFTTFTGCSLVINPPSSLVGLSLSPRGLLLAFGSSVFYAAHSLISQRTVYHTSPLVASAYLNTFVMVQTLVIFPPIYLVTGAVAWSAFAIIFVLVLCTSIIGMVFFLSGIKRIGASRAAIVSSMEPVFTIILAFFLLGEQMTSLQLVGAAIILLGILLLQAERHEVMVKKTIDA